MGKTAKIQPNGHHHHHHHCGDANVWNKILLLQAKQQLVDIQHMYQQQSSDHENVLAWERTRSPVMKVEQLSFLLEENETDESIGTLPGCSTCRRYTTRSPSRWNRPLIFALTILLTIQCCFAFTAIHPKGKKHQSLISYSSSTTTTTTVLQFASSSSSSSSGDIDSNDIDFLNHAYECAKKGFGHTFPNPAVGCVLVRRDTNQVLGAGFHPRAGFPHAEIFALFQAMGHLSDGVAAAESVIQGTRRRTKNQNQQPESVELFETVKHLTEQYASKTGIEQLFSSNAFDDVPVTAYVTLEPCCHYGKTPPCAASLIQAKISRVVIGFRDPNPRVDGGGVQLLQDANIQVNMMANCPDNPNAIKAHQACAGIVTDFVKRITTRPDNQKDYSYINGAMRRGLRSHAGRMKADKSLLEIDWAGPSIFFEMDGNNGNVDDLEGLVQQLPLDPTWLERVDHELWEHELILLRLNKAIKKKKGAKLLGERIADQLQAHVAQTIGHTALLYRPGIPPLLDLTTLSQQVQIE